MEIFKDIVGFEGLYQVSNLGRVKSLKFNKEKILKQIITNNGYLKIDLCKNSKVYINLLHRLVAQTFIPNYNNKPQVNHKNGIKTDNRVENLEWVTCSENQLHAYSNNLNHKGEKHSQSKLTNKQVLKIKKDNRSQYKIAKEYNVSQALINNIKNKKIWNHI